MMTHAAPSALSVAERRQGTEMMMLGRHDQVIESREDAGTRRCAAR